ncbi:MAG TPA: hypothetical protein V6C85_02295 [Allocoleopsis sp.]
MKALNSFRFAIAFFSPAVWVPLLLLGSGSLADSIPAMAQQRLPEPPRIFDELPPATPPSVPALDTPSGFPVPSTLPNSPDAEREYNFQAPPPPVAPRSFTPTAYLYRVDVFSDNPVSLSQVRQLEPDAFVRQDGVIQAGVFADRNHAQSRVRALAEQGIRAQVTRIAAGGDAGLVGSGGFSSDRSLRGDSQELSARDAETPTTGRAYFVVIPGSRNDLPNIADRVIQLGVSRHAVYERSQPRGPHVAVGPFDEREKADRWSNYLRSMGMDARVYFGR